MIFDVATHAISDGPKDVCRSSGMLSIWLRLDDDNCSKSSYNNNNNTNNNADIDNNDNNNGNNEK